MKRALTVLAVTMIVSLLAFLGSSSLYAATNAELLETFTKEVEGLYQDIEELSKVTGDALKENELWKSALINTINGIQERADTLVELAKVHEQEWQSEAVKILEHCDDLNTELEKQEFDEMVMGFVRIAVSLNNLEMMFPQYLLSRINKLTQELKITVDESDPDLDNLEPLVEMLIIHARQLNFNADIFDKKIWKEFIAQLWEMCLELDEAVEKEEEEYVKALLEEIDYSLKILSKLIK